MHLSNVVGQGSYGCVHKPSLKCRYYPETKQRDTRKLSKTILRDEAKDELEQYKLVDKADPHAEFHLGVPEECDIANNVYNTSSLRKCGKFGTEVLKNMSDYELLIMNDGGDNLKVYSEKVQTWPKSAVSTKKCQSFLVETLRLFRGLDLFQKHGVLLNDIKPQNIVFDGTRLSFIDFGMTQNQTELESNLLKHNSYAFSILHWNYPWEMYCLDYYKFNTIISKSTLWKQVLRANLQTRSGEFYSQLTEFFANTLKETQTLMQYQTSANMVFNDFDGFIDAVVNKQLTYEEFVPKCLNTIDSFGLGLTLLHWLHHAEDHLNNETLVARLRTIYEGMINQNVLQRLTLQSAHRMVVKALIESNLIDGDELQSMPEVTINEKFVSNRAVAEETPMESSPSSTETSAVNSKKRRRRPLARSTKQKKHSPDRMDSSPSRSASSFSKNAAAIAFHPDHAADADRMLHSSPSRSASSFSKNAAEIAFHPDHAADADRMHSSPSRSSSSKKAAAAFHF
jgi:serine/threonine protein kinase